MKVFAKVPPHLSQAMFRVERALMAHAPENVQFVGTEDEADVVILHVIGYPETIASAMRLRANGQQYIIIQYCLRTTQEPHTDQWLDLWQNAKVVWSYYDLYRLMKDDGRAWAYDCFHFYYAPLGLSNAFRKPFVEQSRTIGVMTSGYVSAPSAEAIEETIHAADSLGLSAQHLGPVPEGLTRGLPGNWSAINNIPDDALARLYQRSKWVSGLRHGEGFELPALEGLSCGARPILFDRPEMRHWYGNYGVFVPECHGEVLEQHLVNVFRTEPLPVTAHERAEVHDRFNWSKIVTEFWQRVL
jgi:hypothetical protein